MKKLIINSKSVMILLALFLLLSTSAFARPVTDAAFDSIRGGLVQINNFFTGQQYQPYAKAIDFFFFSFLFIAIYMMGARYAFKEIKRPEQVIVILLGLMTAFLLVLADISAVALLPFIHWLFYLLLFILYWWLLKGIKNNFWRFVLALLLTLLTIGLIQGLFNTLTAPQFGTIGAPDGPGFGGFGFGNFFKDWGNNFGTIGVPQFTTPGIGGISDWGSNLFGGVDTTKITGPVTETTTEKKEVVIVKEEGSKTTTTTTTTTDGGTTPPTNRNWTKYWPWLLLLLLPLFGWGGYKLWKRRKPRSGTEPTSADETTVQQIIDEIMKYILLKKAVLDKIREIIKRKRKATLAFWEVYHKKINDPAFLMDPESDEHKALMSEQDEVTKLLRLELALEKDLIELRKLEEELSGTNSTKGKIVEWSEKISRIYAKTREGLFTPLHQDWNPLTITVQNAAPDWYLEALSKIFNILIRLNGREFLRRFMGKALLERFLGRDNIERLLGDKGLVEEVKEAVLKYFLLAKKEEEVEKHLRNITNLKQVEYWLKEGKYEKWRGIQSKEAQELKDYFEQQERLFYETIPELDAADELVFDANNKVVFKSRGTLMPLINKQMRYLQHLVEILKFLESSRKSFTSLQELNVAVQDPADPTKWIDINPDYYVDTRTNAIVAPANVNKQEIEFYWRGYTLDRQPIKVFTNFAEGLPPFRVACYVDNAKKAELTAIQKYAIEPVVRFFTTQIPAGKTIGEYEIGQLAPGTHEIAVIAISPKDTYRRHSKRTIVINYTGTVPPPPPPPPGTPHTILRLTPTNSTPERPLVDSSGLPVNYIEIVGNYHKGVHSLKIAKGSDSNFPLNHIHIVDTKRGSPNSRLENAPHVNIRFLDNGDCVIYKTLKESILVVNGANINRPLTLNNLGTNTIKINDDYEFIAEVIQGSTDPIPSITDYELSFPVRLRLGGTPPPPYEPPYGPYDPYGEYGEYGQPYGEYGPYGPYGEYGPKNMYEPYNNDYGKGDVKGYLYSGSNTGAGNKKDEPKEANSEWKEMNLNEEPKKDEPRVLMVTYEMGLHRGGVGAQSLLIYKNLTKKGFKIDVIENSFEIKELIFHRNGKKCKFKSYDKFMQACNPRLYNIIYFQWYPVRIKIDEVITKLKLHFNQAKIVYVIRNDSREGLKYTEHSDNNPYFNHLKFDIERQRLMVELSDLVVHLTPASYAKFEEYYGATIKSKSVVISDAVELSDRKFSRPQKYAKDTVLLHLGRLTEDKGTFKLAAAYNYIYRSSKNKNFRFIFAGVSHIPNYQDVILKQMPEVPRDKVEFTGFVDLEAKTRYFQMADLFILPTYREMLSNAVLEALVTGVPTLLTRLTTMDELCYQRGATVPIGLVLDKVPEVEDIIKSLGWSINNLGPLKRRSVYFKKPFKSVYSFDNFERKMKLVFGSLFKSDNILQIQKLCQALEQQDSKNLPREKPINLEKEYDSPIYDVDVSYIVPVYGVERYVLSCIRSLVNQKFTGTYNILVINDKTPDASIRLVRQEFRKEIEEEKIIILDNEWKIEGKTAVGNARNYGFYKIVNGIDGKEIKPKYISHFDSDDISFPTRTQVLFDYMKKSKADMVCARAISIDEFNRPTMRRNNFDWDCKRLSIMYEKNQEWIKKLQQKINFAKPDSWMDAEKLFIKELPAVREKIEGYVQTGEPLVHNQTTMVTIEAMHKAGEQDRFGARSQDYKFWLKMSSMGVRMDFLNISVAYYRFGKERDLASASYWEKRGNIQNAFNYYFNYIFEFLRDFEITKSVPNQPLVNQNRFNLENVLKAINEIIRIAKTTNNPSFIKQIADLFRKSGYDKKYGNLAQIIFEALKEESPTPPPEPPRPAPPSTPPLDNAAHEITITKPSGGTDNNFEENSEISIEATTNLPFPEDFYYHIKIFEKLNNGGERDIKTYRVKNGNLRLKINAKDIGRAGTYNIFLRVMNVYPGDPQPHLDSKAVIIIIKPKDDVTSEWANIKSMPRNDFSQFNNFLKEVAGRKLVSRNPTISLIEEVSQEIIKSFERIVPNQTSFNEFKHQRREYTKPNPTLPEEIELELARINHMRKNATSREEDNDLARRAEAIYNGFLDNHNKRKQEFININKEPIEFLNRFRRYVKIIFHTDKIQNLADASLITVLNEIISAFDDFIEKPEYDIQQLKIVVGEKLRSSRRTARAA